MWYAPEKYNKNLANLNQEYLNLKGELDDKEAKLTLIKFLRNNLSFTVELLMGIKLSPFQEIALKGMLNRNFSMLVFGRGCGKTFIAAIYCILQCIFEPGTKILVAGPTFRTARFIFNYIEKTVDSKNAALLAQAFGIKAKRNDQYEWQINGGSITAIPLNGEKIRGFRANILVLDEFLLLPEELIKTVLMPFLVAPQNMAERIKIRQIEDRLIQQGKMTEADRMNFENNSKMIALSSASYTFENLYKTYQEWMGNIYSDKGIDPSYFIFQMSYEAMPEHMIDKTVIEEAKSGGQSHSSFLREYCAQFTDGSDSYFSAKKMYECTVQDGQEPTTRIFGEKQCEYILGIDPSFSNSPSSDYFAMSLVEVDKESKTATLVNTYAVAGGDLKNHINYLFYLLKNFNIVMICIDNAGFQFIDSCNESDLFTSNNLHLKFFDFDADKDGTDKERELREVKRSYNYLDKKIVFKQLFTTTFLRNANEYLQACIDYKKIWFASRTSSNGSVFDQAMIKNVEIELTPFENQLDFIEAQDDMIYDTKKQCTLIEVKTTAKGTQSFDLPQHLKRSTSANRARKDNYTSLMLANWGVKLYFEINSIEEESIDETFMPILI
jgi:hypothetical protein